MGLQNCRPRKEFANQEGNKPNRPPSSATMTGGWKNLMELQRGCVYERLLAGSGTNKDVENRAR
jgi:hypothetical protein